MDQRKETKQVSPFLTCSCVQKKNLSSSQPYVPNMSMEGGFGGYPPQGEALLQDILASYSRSVISLFSHSSFSI